MSKPFSTVREKKKRKGKVNFLVQGKSDELNNTTYTTWEEKFEINYFLENTLLNIF